MPDTAVLVGRPRTAGTAAPASRSLFVVGVVLVFVVAFALRLWVVLGQGGLGGNYFYDPAVYYSAADALTHGLMPYRDFVLVHPPVIALVTVPFAVAGRLTTDHAGFILANLGYTVLSGLNSVLVVAVARRFGIARYAALLGGLFYAVWLGAINAEYLVRLEPLGNFFLLLSLLALARLRRDGTTRASVVCGVLLACLVNVKVWFVVPVLIVLGWQLVTSRSLRRTAIMSASVVAGCLVIDLPFFAIAGSRMFRAIVTTQLGRGNDGVSVHTRLDKISGISQAFGNQFNDDGVSSSGPAQLLVVAFLVLALVSGAIALTNSVGRLWVSMLACQFVVFALVQVWFYTYSDYLAVPFALIVATAAGAGGRYFSRRAGVVTSAVLVASSAVLAVVALAGPGLGMVPPYPRAASFADRVRDVRCVVSDSPMNLVELNALDRSFSPGCTNIVDVVGLQLGAPRPGDGRSVAHHPHQARAELCRYYRSGQVVALGPKSLRQLSPPACARSIRRGRVLGRSEDVVLFRID